MYGFCSANCQFEGNAIGFSRRLMVQKIGHRIYSAKFEAGHDLLCADKIFRAEKTKGLER